MVFLSKQGRAVREGDVLMEAEVRDAVAGFHDGKRLQVKECEKALEALKT